MPYVTVSDFRDPDTIDLPDRPTDTTIQAVIDYVEPLFERLCRQWFESRDLDFYFDGQDSDTIHFGVPIISIDALYINDDTNPLDSSLYKVYATQQTAMGDRRGNPKISLVRSLANANIFINTSSCGIMKMYKGRQNCRVVGAFGYLDNDGNTPAPVVEAIKRLVVEYLQNPAYSVTPLPPSPGSAPGVIVEEETDDHRIKYAVGAISTTRVGLTDITADPYVQRIIKLYRAPIGIATPANWTV